MDVDAAQQPLRETVPFPLQTLTTKVSIMQHVPKGFRIEWCELLADEINHFCEEQTTEAFALLLLLPKVILLAADRGGRRAKKAGLECLPWQSESVEGAIMEHDVVAFLEKETEGRTAHPYGSEDGKAAPKNASNFGRQRDLKSCEGACQ